MKQLPFTRLLSLASRQLLRDARAGELLTVLGLFAWKQLPVEEFPDIRFPVAVVSASSDVIGVRVLVAHRAAGVVKVSWKISMLEVGAMPPAAENASAMRPSAEASNARRLPEPNPEPVITLTVANALVAASHADERTV